MTVTVDAIPHAPLAPGPAVCPPPAWADPEGPLTDADPWGQLTNRPGEHARTHFKERAVVEGTGHDNEAVRVHLGILREDRWTAATDETHQGTPMVHLSGRTEALVLTTDEARELALALGRVADEADTLT